MHIRRKECRGFTLIELVATITIIAVLATVALPSLTVATPFVERGYADGVAASLRQSRSVALASECDVQFTINAAGYSASQHAPGASNHCAAGGAWSTPVRSGDGQNLGQLQPADVTLGAGRVFVFASDGSVAPAPVTINIGPHAITIDASGVVSGP